MKPDPTFADLSEALHPVFLSISEMVDGDVLYDSPRFMWHRLGDVVASVVGSVINQTLHTALIEHRLDLEGGPHGGKRS
jgi:hypothetical protein